MTPALPATGRAKKWQIPTDSCTLSCEQIRGWESCTTWYHDFITKPSSNSGFLHVGALYIGRLAHLRLQNRHFFGGLLWLDTPPPFTSKEEVHEELQTEAARHLYSRALIQGYLEDPDNFFLHS